MQIDGERIDLRMLLADAVPVRGKPTLQPRAGARLVLDDDAGMLAGVEGRAHREIDWRAAPLAGLRKAVRRRTGADEREKEGDLTHDAPRQLSGPP